MCCAVEESLGTTQQQRVPGLWFQRQYVMYVIDVFRVVSGFGFLYVGVLLCAVCLVFGRLRQ